MIYFSYNTHMSIFLLLFIFLIIALMSFLTINICAFFLGAPFAPSAKTSIRGAMKKIGLSSRDTVFDLGSGDGRVLVEASRFGAKSLGYEFNFFLYIWSRYRLRTLKNRELVSIYWSNFWTQKLTSATVIFAFLLPESMTRLEKKLYNEVAKGTYVLTYLSRLPQKRALTSYRGIYIYRY